MGMVLDCLIQKLQWMNEKMAAKERGQQILEFYSNLQITRKKEAPEIPQFRGENPDEWVFMAEQYFVLNFLLEQE